MNAPASSVCTASGRGMLPKVPSLLFDLEMEDGTKVAHSSDVMDLQMVETELRRFLRPCNASVAWVSQQAEAALVGVAPGDALRTVEQALLRAGHRVCVRKALGGGSGPLCLHNLRHTFLSVSPPGMEHVLVVDPSFAEQFRIAKPTSRYESILACLPSVLVLPEDRVPPLITFLCAELTAAFRASSTVVPPWRQLSSMLSKWQPRRSLDVPSTAQPEQHQAKQQVNAAALHGGRTVAGRVVMSASMHIKPMVCEPPHRVYGGFSASFGNTFINMAT